MLGLWFIVYYFSSQVVGVGHSVDYVVTKNPLKNVFKTFFEVILLIFAKILQKGELWNFVLITSYIVISGKSCR